MVHAGGRPRTTSLSHDEMIELGKEMVNWVSINKPLHLSKWYTVEKGYLYEEWKAMIQIKEFLPYYETSMRIIGEQYLDKNSNVREGVSQRWQRVYFKDLKEEEDEKEDRKMEKEFQFKKKLLELEALVKSKQNEVVSEDIKSKFDELINQFSSSMKESKVSNIE